MAEKKGEFISLKPYDKGGTWDPRAELTGYSDEIADLKERFRDEALAYIEEHQKNKKITGRGVGRNQQIRSVKSIMLSDDSVWGEALKEYYYNRPKGADMGSLLNRVSNRIQHYTTRNANIINDYRTPQLEQGHHANNLQSFDELWMGPKKTLQKFLQRGAADGEYFGDTFKNFEGNAYIEPVHRTAHHGNYSEPEEFRFKLDGQDGDAAYDSWKASKGKLRSDAGLLLGDNAATLYRGEVDKALIDEGLVSDTAYKPMPTEDIRKIQDFTKQNPNIGLQALEEFKKAPAPDPASGFLQNLRRYQKLAFDNPYVKSFGTLPLMGMGFVVNPNTAEGAGNIVADLQEGEDVKTEDVVQMGTGVGIEALKTGGMALAAGSLMKGTVGKVAGSVLGGPVGWALGAYALYEAADVFTGAATGKSLTERVETAYEPIKPEWVKEREEERSYYEPAGAPVPPTSGYRLPPHAGSANPYMNNFEAP